MQCGRCGTGNPERAKFCLECGAPLGNPAEPEAARAEGTVAGPAPSPAAGGTPAGRPAGSGSDSGGFALPEAERRQITVVFCDLVASTSLSARLDPEDLRDVIRSYQAACDAVLRRFGGHLAQVLGDGILAYFGYPTAQEDDARRAVDASLSMLAAIRVLNDGPLRDRGVRLSVRIGVHTGPVVVGRSSADGRTDGLAIGETPNVAARVQTAAEPDTVVLSAATAALVQGYYLQEDLGERVFRGVEAPLRLFRVLAPSGAASRFDVTAPGGHTPLVGRRQEIDLLLEHWGRARRGRGQTVILTGEAGIGKSRIAETLRVRLGAEPHERLVARCSSHGQDTPLQPLVGLFERLFGFAPGDGPADRLDRIERALRARGVTAPEAVPPIAALLSVKVPTGRYPAAPLPPVQQKQRLFEAMRDAILAPARSEPLFVVIEDLHWMDPSTEQFVSLLAERVPSHRVLLLLTTRPADRPSWPHTAITLNRLSREEVAEMAERAAGGRPLPEEVTREIQDRTDGVPLFVEEMTRAVLESGCIEEQDRRFVLRGELPPVAIPASLQDLLMARLDRLGSLKSVAQLAAAIGREFPFDLLAAAEGGDERRLERALSRLLESGILQKRGAGAHATFFFRHALLHEAAYASLLKSTRLHHHGRIAEAVCRIVPDAEESSPELLAHHFTQAGVAERAVTYRLLAGRRAVERSANFEATRHLEMALDLLGKLAPGPDRTSLELDILTGLVPGYYSTKGYTSQEVARTCERALRLCDETGDLRRPIFVRGLWSAKMVRAEFAEALALARDLWAAAARSPEEDLQLEAEKAIGISYFYLGEPEPARFHLDSMLARYDPARHHAAAYHYGQDPSVTGLAWLAMVLWGLGFPDEAARRSEEALERGRTLGHAYSLAMALVFACWVRQFRGEPEEVERKADEAMALTAEKHFPVWGTIARILRGWSLVMRGGGDEALAELRAAIEAKPGAASKPYYHALLAEALAETGQPDRGADLTREALASARRQSELWCEAEVLRLHAELLDRSDPGRAAEAEALVREARESARRRGLRGTELRAAATLAQMLRRRGDAAEARRLLVESHDAFPESGSAQRAEAERLLQEIG